jgi:transcriptional regulator with XRE-family HTH domain
MVVLWLPMAKKKAQSYNRIREVLAEKGVSQAQLADLLDVRFATVNRFCNGHREPTLDMLYRIAKVLKVSARELIRE